MRIVFFPVAVDLLCGRFSAGIAVGGCVIERLMFVQEVVKVFTEV